MARLRQHAVPEHDADSTPCADVQADVLNGELQRLQKKIETRGTVHRVERAKLLMKRELTNSGRKVTIKARLAPRKKLSPPLKRLFRIADFFPLATRKQIKAMAGDYYPEIIRLRRERRYKAARWNEVLAWGYTGWYVLRGPIDLLISAVRKVVKGS